MNKIKRRLNNNFTTISNEILKNKDISLKAKGLHITVMSLPDDWNFTVKGIASLLKEGEEAVRSAIKELMKYGYVFYKKNKDDQGRWEHCYIFFQENPDMENPDMENPDMENPDAEKCHVLLRTNIPRTNISRTNIINSLSNKKNENFEKSENEIITEKEKISEIIRTNFFDNLEFAEKQAIRIQNHIRLKKLNIKNEIEMKYWLSSHWDIVSKYETYRQKKEIQKKKEEKINYKLGRDFEPKKSRSSSRRNPALEKAIAINSAPITPMPEKYKKSFQNLKNNMNMEANI